MARHGKNYNADTELVDREKRYTLSEAWPF